MSAARRDVTAEGLAKLAAAHAQSSACRDLDSVNAYCVGALSAMLFHMVRDVGNTGAQRRTVDRWREEAAALGISLGSAEEGGAA